jgi:predicted RNA-binding Zn ribbon-like protein
MSTGPGHPAPHPLPKHEFLAGRLALDFCNSLSRCAGPGPRDRALRPVDFQHWAGRYGLTLDRAPSPAALARLHRLRGALFGIFDALNDGDAPRPGDLSLLNGELAEARAAEQLAPTSGSFAWQDRAASPVDRFRNAVARDAADLLLGDPRRIKRCPNHDCRWLFYDGSKNLSRRWCAMDDCGTKDKVRRFRQRKPD